MDRIPSSQCVGGSSGLSNVRVNSSKESPQDAVRQRALADYTVKEVVLPQADQEARKQRAQKVFEWFGQHAQDAKARALRDQQIIELIEQGIDPSQVNEGQETPLIVAAHCGHVEAVRLLLRQIDTDVNHKDRFGNTALLFAAKCDHLGIVQMLLACPGIQINEGNSCQTTPILFAAWHGFEAIVRCLLAQPGIMVNAMDTNGDTALQCATKMGRTAIVQLLLEHTDSKGQFVDFGIHNWDRWLKWHTQERFQIITDIEGGKAIEWRFEIEPSLDYAVIQPVLLATGRIQTQAANK